MTTTYSEWCAAHQPRIPPMPKEMERVIVDAARKQGLAVSSNVCWYYRAETRRDETVWRLLLLGPSKDEAFTRYVARTFFIPDSVVVTHPEPVIRLPLPSFTWHDHDPDIFNQRDFMFVSEARAAVAAYAQQCAELLGGAE